MSFLYPGLLLGFLAVGVPVAIHLLDRLRIRNTRWATNRFLREILRRQQSRVRVRDLILLILRCLVIAFLVLAFAHPVTNQSKSTTFSGASVVFLLIDDSASMRQSDGVKTRFDLAKEKGGEILNQLPSGSAAALILFTDEPEAVIGTPTLDLSLVKRSLQQTAPTDRAGNVTSSLRMALDRLSHLEAQHRRIVVLTDGQSSVWRDGQDIRALANDHPEVEIEPILVGDNSLANHGVTDVRLDDGNVLAGNPVKITTEISNFSAQDAESIQVSVSMDGAPPADQQVIDRIPAGGVKNIHLTAGLAAEGPHVVEVAISNDAFDLDNHRALAFNAASRLDTALYAAPADDARNAAFFLAHALVPVPPDRVDAFLLKLDQITDASALYLNHPQCVFIIGPESLAPDAVSQLRHFVEKGGTVVLVPDAGMMPSLASDPSWKDLLPGIATSVKTPVSGVNWQQTGFTHPITSLWNDPSAGKLGSVTAYRYFSLAPMPDDGAPVWHPVIYYSTHESAIVERSLGDGHIVFFSAGLDPDSQNLALHPAFVPIVQRLVHYAAGTADTSLNSAPGKPFRATVDPALVGQPFYVQRLRNPQPPRLAGRVEQENGKTVVQVQDTTSVGAYLVTTEGKKDPIAAFAVQLAPEESDLRRISDDQLPIKSKSPASKPTLAGGKQATAWPSWLPEDFWVPLVLLTVILSLVEMVCAHLFSQRIEKA